MTIQKAFGVFILILIFSAAPAGAEEDKHAMAKKLANPLASLISVHIEYDTYSDIAPASGSQLGLSDISQSLFFSPKEPKKGIIWGIGPVLLIPSASEDLLGGENWTIPFSAIVSQV